MAVFACAYAEREGHTMILVRVCIKTKVCLFVRIQKDKPIRNCSASTLFVIQCFFEFAIARRFAAFRTLYYAAPGEPLQLFSQGRGA